MKTVHRRPRAGPATTEKGLAKQTMKSDRREPERQLLVASSMGQVLTVAPLR